MEAIVEGSPRRMARVTGLFYLVTILAGVFAQGFVSARLIIDGDAAATVSNIVSHRSLFEAGFTVYMIEMACNVVITALFYMLLRPVSKSLSLTAAFLGLVGCTIKTITRLFYVAPLLVLGGSHYLSVFNQQQLQALALLFLKINDHGAAIGLIFFGFYALLKGYLIVRSTFLPRVLGVLSMIGGLCWLTFLSQTLGYRLFQYTALFGLVAAGVQIFWLLAFGLNEEKWNEQARANAARI